LVKSSRLVRLKVRRAEPMGSCVLISRQPALRIPGIPVCLVIRNATYVSLVLWSNKMKYTPLKKHAAPIPQYTL
jgi:hypothetical protein